MASKKSAAAGKVKRIRGRTNTQTIHVIDERDSVWDELEALEKKVGVKEFVRRMGRIPSSKT